MFVCVVCVCVCVYVCVCVCVYNKGAGVSYILTSLVLIQNPLKKKEVLICEVFEQHVSM